MKPKIPELTAIQRKVLRLLADGGHIDILMRVVVTARGVETMQIHGATVRSLRAHQYTQEADLCARITETGRAALEERP